MLWIVGLGPGGARCLTEQARRALQDSQAVLGYKAYIEQARPWLAGKDVRSSGMTHELARAGEAMDLALGGQQVALVSGGDPGVYGMAAVVFELARSRGLALGGGVGELTVEVVPGVPAAMAAAALLGAPLAHDFACISLSDRLTPWNLIERRLDLTAQADLVIALYNPRSKGRDWQYARALELVGRHRAPSTPVGVVRRATREGQGVALHDLTSAPGAEVDMQTIVIIGNSQSFTHAGRMVTPRGYLGKYGDPTAEAQE